MPVRAAPLGPSRCRRSRNLPPASFSVRRLERTLDRPPEVHGAGPIADLHDVARRVAWIRREREAQKYAVGSQTSAGGSEYLGERERNSRLEHCVNQHRRPGQLATAWLATMREAEPEATGDVPGRAAA